MKNHHHPRNHGRHWRPSLAPRGASVSADTGLAPDDRRDPAVAREHLRGHKHAALACALADRRGKENLSREIRAAMTTRKNARCTRAVRLLPDRLAQPVHRPPAQDRWDLYSLLGIARPTSWHARAARPQLCFFRRAGRPDLSIEAVMQQGSWLDYGMFPAEHHDRRACARLDTCPQAAFTSSTASSRDN